MSRFKSLAALVLIAGLGACAVEPAGNVTAFGTPAVQSGARTIADYRLRLTPPPDYCALDRGQPFDAMMLGLLDETIAGALQLLDVWRDCSALAASRRGVQDFSEPGVAVTAVLQDGRPMRAPLPRAMLLDQLAVAFALMQEDTSLHEELEADLRNRFDGTIGRLAAGLGHRAAFGGITNLGVKAQDENAVYLAMISRADTNGTNVVFGNIVAVTEINGLILEIAVFADHAGDAHLDRLLAEAQSVMQRLVAANNHPSWNDV
jgi:hypothetical protein